MESGVISVLACLIRLIACSPSECIKVVGRLFGAKTIPLILGELPRAYILQVAFRELHLFCCAYREHTGQSAVRIGRNDFIHENDTIYCIVFLLKHYRVT